MPAKRTSTKTKATKTPATSVHREIEERGVEDCYEAIASFIRARGDPAHVAQDVLVRIVGEMAGATFGDDPDDLAEDIADTIYILQVIAAKAASEDLGQRVALLHRMFGWSPQPQST